MPSRNKWYVLIMFMFAHAVNDGFIWILPPLLPVIRESLNLSYSESGLILTSYRFFGNILQAPAGYLIHFAPASTILVLGFLWSSVGLLLATLIPGYMPFLWLASISSIGRATYHPLAVTMLSRIFEKKTFGRVMGFHLSGSGFGMVAAPLLVGLLVTNFSWQLPLQVWSILGILVGLSLYYFLKQEKNNGQNGQKPLAWPFYSRPLLTFLVGSSTWALAQSGVTSFLPLFLVDQRGFSAESAALLYGVISVGGMVSKPMVGALMDRMGTRKPVIIGGFVLGSMSMLGLAMLKVDWIIYTSIVVLGLFVTGHAGLADTLMIEMIPSHRREETLGFIYTARMGIGALSPIVVGVLSQYTSLQISFASMAVLGLVAALVMSLAHENTGEA